MISTHTHKYFIELLLLYYLDAAPPGGSISKEYGEVSKKK